MRVVLCDICERGIRGAVFEIHVIRGEALTNENGPLRVAQGGSTLLYVCEACGRWLQQAIDHLGRAHREAAEVRQLLEPAPSWHG